MRCVSTGDRFFLIAARDVTVKRLNGVSSRVVRQREFRAGVPRAARNLHSRKGGNYSQRNIMQLSN